jgi:autotransporter-associated beta strand protein
VWARRGSFQICYYMKYESIRKNEEMRAMRTIGALLGVFCWFFGVLLVESCQAAPAGVTIVPVGSATGWAKNSVNAAVFRNNSVVAHGNTQYTAFYDNDSYVVLAKRTLGSTTWVIQKTPYTGNTSDAHNVISIAVDGSGVLHMSWDMHNGALRYVRSVSAGSLNLTAEMPMTGDKETSVTYPQFYNLPDGDLLFLYRDGASGNGSAMLNRYDVQTKTWSIVQHPVITGGGTRSAYLNPLAIDSKGGIHLSWVWRDTSDVATNHDICYAYSPDQGVTWRKSTGAQYSLPITFATAEVAYAVPQNSELINQTAMTVDDNDQPLIATYWRDQNSTVPQYRLVWYDGSTWRAAQVGNRTLAFSLSGSGTKSIPISRPQVVAGDRNEVFVIFRDEELGSRVSVAMSGDADHTDWQVINLTDDAVDAWEPTYDPVEWKSNHQLHLFLEKVEQGDAETTVNTPPQPVSILEWTPQSLSESQSTAFFSDTFNRANNATVGTNDNGLGGTVTANYIERNSAAIASNALSLAGTSGSASAHVTPNLSFTASQITGGGFMDIEFDFNPLSNNNTNSNQWVGLTIGQSGAPGDIGSVVTSGATNKDFSVLLRDNGSFQAFSTGDNVLVSDTAFDTAPAATEPETYHIKLTLSTTSFAAGSPFSVSGIVSGELDATVGTDTAPLDLNGGTAGTKYVGTWVGAGNFITVESNTTSVVDNLKISAAVPPTDAYWTGDQDGKWNTNNSGNTNWATDATGTTDLGRLPDAFTNVKFAANNARNLTTTLGQDFSIRSLTFATGTAGVRIGGASSLSLDTPGITMESGAGAATINVSGTTGGVILGGSQTWTNNSANPLTVASPISGVQAVLTKAGSGTLLLSGINTRTGGTIINAGTLSVSGGDAIGDTGVVVLTDAAGATFNLAVNETVGSLSGGGTTGGNVTLGANTSLTTGGSDASTTFAGVISGTGGLTKVGTGTFTLTGVNTYTAGTTISGGSLQLGSGGTTGSIVGNVANSGTLIFNRSDDFTLGGVISGSGVVTKAGTGTGSGSTATGANANVVTLSGTSTFTGNVNIINGIVRATNSSSLGAGTKTIVVNNGTAGNPQLRLNGSEGDIVLPSTFTYNTSNGGTNAVTILNEAGNNTIGGKIIMTAGGGNTVVQSNAGMLNVDASVTANTTARVFTLQGAGNGTVSGVISNGTGSNTVAVAKNGTGTWTLTGANTYTGLTTINAGTLALGASDRIANTSNLVLGGGAFSTGGFNETVGTLTLTNNTVATIDLGGGTSVLKFSSLAAGTGTVSVTNWSRGSDQLFIGSTAALTADQLAQIKFGTTAAQQLATGEVVPIPAASSWSGIDVAVGSDGQSRVLWEKNTGEIMLWSVNAAGTITTQRNYGPFEGWHAIAIAANTISGADNGTRILWKHTDGSVKLWSVDELGALNSSPVYGPFEGWDALNIAVGGDNKTRILWQHTDGSVGLWTLDAITSVAQVSYSPTYGPFAGWSVADVAVGSDNSTHLLWQQDDGAVGLWRIDPAGVVSYSPVFGPYAGWSALGIDVGGDNKARLLWQHSSGQMGLWTVDSAGTVSYSPVYGPYAGWSARGIAVSSDNQGRVLWRKEDGAMSVWTLDAAGVMVSTYAYGPY